MSHMKPQPCFTFRAHLFFLDNSVGGRNTEALPGYRPHLKVTNDMHTSCVLNPEDDTQKMRPDSYCTVNAMLPFTQEVTDYLGKPLADFLQPGQQIHLNEGSKIIAVGLILAQR